MPSAAAFRRDVLASSAGQPAAYNPSPHRAAISTPMPSSPCQRRHPQSVAWCALGARDRARPQRAGPLGYRKITWRAAHRAFKALGQMPARGHRAAGAPKALKINLRKEHPKAPLLRRAGGLSPEEIEEIAAPTYGLDGQGMPQALGDFVAELVVTGTDTVKPSWKRPTRQASVPQAIKAEHAEELELKQAVQDIRRMLPAQRDRLEHLYLGSSGHRRLARATRPPP